MTDTPKTPQGMNSFKELMRKVLNTSKGKADALFNSRKKKPAARRRE